MIFLIFRDAVRAQEGGVRPAGVHRGGRTGRGRGGHHPVGLSQQRLPRHPRFIDHHFMSYVTLGDVASFADLAGLNQTTPAASSTHPPRVHPRCMR